MKVIRVILIIRIIRVVKVRAIRLLGCYEQYAGEPLMCSPLTMRLRT